MLLPYTRYRFRALRENDKNYSYVPRHQDLLPKPFHVDEPQIHRLMTQNGNEMHLLLI